MDIPEKIDLFCRARANNPLPDCGLLLVGSNPLPVYALIKALRPQHVLLVGTEEVSDYLQKIIAMLPDTVEKIDYRICNPFKSQDIQDKVKEILNTVNHREMWFSYTAGTKSMSVNGFEEWSKVVSQDNMHWGIYVSPYGPRVFLNRLDEGFLLAPHDEFDSPSLSFQEVIDLHLNTLKDNTCRDDHKDTVLCELAHNIHAVVSRDRRKGIDEYLKLLPPAYLTGTFVKVNSYEECLFVKEGISLLNDINYEDSCSIIDFNMRSWADEVKSLYAQDINTLDDVVTTYFDNNFPQKSSIKKKAKSRIKAMKWLVGQWLEVWVATALLESGLFSEVRDSCILWPHRVPHESPFQYEVDVCAMRGITPFIFTCTIENSARGFNKEKLFEVGQRSRQLGGEHARSALVCLSDDSKGIKQLINEGWTGYNTVQVFGIDEIYAQDAFIKNVSEWVESLEKSY
jgi:hypothetical protein